MRVEPCVLTQLTIDKLRPARCANDDGLHHQSVLSNATAHFVTVQLGEPNIKYNNVRLRADGSPQTGKAVECDIYMMPIQFQQHANRLDKIEVVIDYQETMTVLAPAISIIAVDAKDIKISRIELIPY